MDIPKRQHVIQIDVPVSRKKTIDETIDPRKQIPADLHPKLHGINPVKKTFLQKTDAEILPHPGSAPLPKNNAKPKKHHKATKKIVKDIKANDVLAAARDVELKAAKLTKGIHVSIIGKD